jgi:hypothetical protein
MAVRLSALRDPKPIVRLEGLGQLKNQMTSSGLEPATYRLVAQCVNQLRYRVPRPKKVRYFLEKKIILNPRNNFIFVLAV